jgi:hypothetical protein
MWYENLKVPKRTVAASTKSCQLSLDRCAYYKFHCHFPLSHCDNWQLSTPKKEKAVIKTDWDQEGPRHFLSLYRTLSSIKVILLKWYKEIRSWSSRSYRVLPGHEAEGKVSYKRFVIKEGKAGTFWRPLKWKLFDSERSVDRQYVCVSEQSYEEGGRDTRQRTVFVTFGFYWISTGEKSNRLVTMYVTFQTANESRERREAST